MLKARDVSASLYVSEGTTKVWNVSFTLRVAPKTEDERRRLEERILQVINEADFSPE